jgi:hypothetical protein
MRLDHLPVKPYFSGSGLPTPVSGYIFHEIRYLFDDTCFAAGYPIGVLFLRLPGEDYSVHATLFKKSEMLSPSLWEMTSPLFISSSPLRMDSMVPGDDMIYSVSFIVLYSSSDIRTMPTPPPRLTMTVSESSITESM